MLNISHPFIVKLHGSFQTPEKLCFVMEYCPGGDLGTHIARERRFPLDKAKFYLCEVILALEELHKNEIIFRDLKPENVLLDDAYNVKIADFGLARPLTCFRGEDSQTTLCIGTTRFMAPELFDKDQLHEIGVEVDIWSLGCIFIELFSNKRPWNYISSSNANCIYYEIFQKKPIPIPSVIPDAIRDIITNCCSYIPEKRMNASQILEKLNELKSTL
mmetsp:Transcript_20464/g.20428  ORF Transcript_20464/g.20428 Transcript_20464/m.20428 type:complete len:217 (+) Transcript_20464:1297-1947(+)